MKPRSGFGRNFKIMKKAVRKGVIIYGHKWTSIVGVGLKDHRLSVN